ncbi:hypothetical protein EYM_02485 [Ignicoccus islandicus DSM 13165]|uniref:Uncharacterized protein n=1 Tax=Ignicoccus islandicus DSM 13165 TaxID=940295 RepID=A0A0U3F9J4_9CREN|nr:hypothetical protein [Ignicoccus islandicus]ALU12329.1 hypothetical protein EYM_02485 [Ignicoccus islandicus DSM 13165]
MKVSFALAMLLLTRLAYPSLQVYKVTLFWNGSLNPSHEVPVKIDLPDQLEREKFLALSNYGILSYCYENSLGECTKDPRFSSGVIWLKLREGTNRLYLLTGFLGASEGEDVFPFYDDFSNGLDKWVVRRFKGDESKECVVENGILWLVKNPLGTGCNVFPKGIKIKWNSTFAISLGFKVNYVCGTSNDGDGLNVLIDGRDLRSTKVCGSGFSEISQGINVNLITDIPYKGGISISNTTEACYLGNDDLVYRILDEKRWGLSFGRLTVVGNGTYLKVT